MADNSQNRGLKIVRRPSWMPDSIKVSDAHRTLYHYTNTTALTSIIENNELWATHFTKLNDTSEIILFKEQLLNRMPKKLLRRLIEILKSRPSLRMAAHKKYGSIKNAADTESANFIKILYETTLGESIKRNVFMSPYIMSFCTHDDDDLYVQENGLLSQWRSYGSRGGVAIVFNTIQLEDALQLEHEKFLYTILGLGSVVYSHKFSEIEAELDPIVNAICDEFIRMYSNEEPRFDDIFGPFVTAAVRYKHRAFYEEREVRLYASPASTEIVALERGGDVLGTRRAKQVFPNLLGKPRIKLFGKSLLKSLPIERVIIGPGLEQDYHWISMKKLTENTNIKVTKSQTPYAEQST